MPLSYVAMFTLYLIYFSFPLAIVIEAYLYLKGRKVRPKGMNEEMYDEMDKFHEALLKRYSKKTLAATIIFVALFCSWYVYATYKEYDWWGVPEGIPENWQLIREIEVVNCTVTKFNFSMKINMVFPDARV